MKFFFGEMQAFSYLIWEFGPSEFLAGFYSRKEFGQTEIHPGDLASLMSIHEISFSLIK